LTLSIVVSGILLAFIGFDSTTSYFFIVLFLAFFYSTLAGNKLVFTNGMFYDEYLAGTSQPYLASAVFILAVKFGFFISLAFHLTLIDEESGASTRSNIDAHSFGGLVLFFAFLIYALNFFIHRRYNLGAFDKIQVAIERNRGEVVEDLAFYDPIQKTTIKRPVVSSDPEERRFIVLIYNLDPRDDLRLAINGKHQQLKSNAIVRMLLFGILLVAFTIIVIVFGSYLDTNYGWFIFIGLLALPISLYGFLYNYNVMMTATVLDGSKFKGHERGVLSRFIPLLHEKKRKEEL